METETHRRAQVTTRVSNPPPTHLTMATNRVQINIYELIRHATGAVTVLSSNQTRFTPRHLSELFLDEQFSLREIIALDIDQQFASDPSLQEPVLVAVNVNLIITERTRSPRGASSHVLQRLSEEQSVETKDLGVKNETQCSICMDGLCKTRGNIIELPQCLHMFHQDCLFEWLRRQNSCPLCRRAPYE